MVRQDALGVVDRRLRPGSRSTPDDWPAHRRHAELGLAAGRRRARRASGSSRYEPRLGQTLEIEDAKFTGTQQVIFEPGLEETRITLEVALEPKDRLRAAGAAAAAPAASRTRCGARCSRFSVELAAERQFGRWHRS